MYLYTELMFLKTDWKNGYMVCKFAVVICYILDVYCICSWNGYFIKVSLSIKQILLAKPSTFLDHFVTHTHSMYDF